MSECVGGCAEYARAWGVDPDTLQHCGSCHGDAEEGYEMCHGEGPDGREYEVCCTWGDSVAALLKAKPEARSPTPSPARLSTEGTGL